MKPKYIVVTILLILLLVFTVFLRNVFFANNNSKKEPTDIYVGVDVAYDNVTEIKLLVDEIRAFFV